MPRTFPWHAVTSDTYHNNSGCAAGKAILQGEHREGTGGKRLCKRCMELNRKERQGTDRPGRSGKPA